MEFTNGMIEKAKKAENADELIEMAKEAGIELSKETAENYYSFLHAEGELTDDELSQVAGGKGRNDPPAPRYANGTKVRIHFIATHTYRYGYTTGTRYYNLNSWCYNVRLFAQENYDDGIYKRDVVDQGVNLENPDCGYEVISSYPPQIAALL